MLASSITFITFKSLNLSFITALNDELIYLINTQFQPHAVPIMDKFHLFQLSSKKFKKIE